MIYFLLFTAFLTAFLFGFIFGAMRKCGKEKAKTVKREMFDTNLEKIKKEYSNFLNYDGSEQS